MTESTSRAFRTPTPALTLAELRNSIRAEVRAKAKSLIGEQWRAEAVQQFFDDLVIGHAPETEAGLWEVLGSDLLLGQQVLSKELPPGARIWDAVQVAITERLTAAAWEEFLDLRQEHLAVAQEAEASPSEVPPTMADLEMQFLADLNEKVEQGDQFPNGEALSKLAERHVPGDFEACWAIIQSDETLASEAWFVPPVDIQGAAYLCITNRLVDVGRSELEARMGATPTPN